MAAILLLTFSLNYTVLTQVVAPAFNAIEEDEARLNLHRVTKAIEREIESLLNHAIDYAQWDESYKFANGEYPDYMDDQVGEAEDVLPNFHANVLAIYNNKGRQLAIRTFDMGSWEEVEVPSFSNDEFPTDHVLLNHPGTDSLISGIYSTPQGPMLVGSSPILTNDKEGPVAGSLIFAAYLNETVLETIAESSGVSFDVIELGSELPENLTEVLAELEGESDAALRTTEDTVSTFGTLPSLDGAGGILIQAEMPRNVSQAGTQTVKIALISILMVGLLDLIIIWFLIQKFVIRPVGALKEHVIYVTSTRNLSERIPVAGNDELSILAGKYNEMLGDIQQSNQELKEAQDELVKQERLSALGELTATVSHEIRNPLTSIRASLLLVQKATGDGLPEVERAVARADRNIERCADIIDELLEHVNEKTYETNALDADAWFEKVADAQVWPEDVTVRKDFAAPDAYVKIDLERMSTVINNLIENALQSMAENPAERTKEVSISSRIADGRYEIVIGDTGPGIDETNLQKIFEPLFSTRGFGVGLGIPIARKVLQGHGGDIHYDSAPGRGTKVTLWIPLADMTGQTVGDVEAA